MTGVLSGGDNCTDWYSLLWGGKGNPPSMLTLHLFGIWYVYSHKSKGIYPYEVIFVGSKTGFPHHFLFLQKMYSDVLLRTFQSQRID